MNVIMDILKFLFENYQVIIDGILGVLMAIIAVAMIIPGEQPEKFLQGIVDFIKKFSKKKPE